MLWQASQEAFAAPRSLGDAVVDAFIGGRHEQLTVWTVLADGDPTERLAPLGGHPVAGHGCVGSVGLILVDDHAGQYVLSAWPTSEDGVYNLVGTVPVTDERWRRVERWVANAAPHVV